ncbi:MAG: oxygen-independent coproporphyrinogen III oxidase [Elusimicrobia bacterium]|nr:oxygen-independent coproporphyrinogen III oxidase [Elusimicrobiota bacterium]
MDINLINKLRKKYNHNLYAMYVEYPHKSIWSKDFSDTHFRTALKNLFSDKKDTPLLLYVHIPFCSRQCFYCTCHTFVTRDYERVKSYMNVLYREIDMLKELFDSYSAAPNFREIHLGGGSPTLLHEKEFDFFIEKLKSIADIKKLSEFAIEVDPRETSKEKLLYYNSKGINRLSFGVQDFDLNVQKAVNRVQPPELLEKVLTPDIRKHFRSINFDIMWGLPRQTPESYKKTIDTTIKLSPDRISLLMLHYAPDVKKHQKLMKQSEIPDVTEKTKLFQIACQMLESNGYVRIGFEHFAKATDELATALKNKTVHWNSLGYTTGRYLDIIGIGSGSSSRITDNYYFQSHYPLADYEASVSDNKFPVYRGYNLNSDDIIRREVIHNLRIYFSLNYSKIEAQYNIEFGKYFKTETASLKNLAGDGILELSENGITVTELGKYFIFHVCRVFDNFNKQ